MCAGGWARTLARQVQDGGSLIGDCSSRRKGLAWESGEACLSPASSRIRPSNRSTIPRHPVSIHTQSARQCYNVFSFLQVLKRQKVHLEAARALQFSEEEFMKTLEMGAS